MNVHMSVHKYVSKYYLFCDMDWKAVRGCKSQPVTAQDICGCKRLVPTPSHPQESLAAQRGPPRFPPPPGQLTRQPGKGLSRTPPLALLAAHRSPLPSLLAGNAGNRKLSQLGLSYRQEAAQHAERENFPSTFAVCPCDSVT